MTREEKKNELIGMFCTGTMYIGDIIDDAMDFAVDKACEWLQHNVYRFYWNNCTQQEHGVYIDKLLEQFKKAMKGGEK